MFKMVVLDLDGTVLRNDKTASERTINANSRVHQMGTKIVLATGRNKASALEQCEKLDVTAGLICCNGALIYDMEKNLVLCDKLIPNHLTFEIVGRFDEDERYHYIYFGDYTVITEKTRKKYLESAGQRKRLLVVDSIIRLIEESGGGAHKIGIRTINEEDAEELICELRARYSDFLSITYSDKNVIEIVNGECSKGIGLKMFEENYEIESDQVMAFGDGLNDYDMFKQAGLSVAMGNAHTELKKIASLVTLGNEEDGVAKVLEDYIKMDMFFRKR
jgi:Cof subfamily protein (haloacid dehalogenase superfamily)